MLSVFKNLKIIWKILIPISLGFASILAFLFLFALPQIEKSMFDEKNHFVKGIVESAISQIEMIETKIKSNEITQEEGMSRIEDLIRSTRFDEDNYLFLTDLQKMLYHGVKPALEGKTLDKFKDVNDKLFLVEMADKLKSSSSTYIEYYWTKPNVEGQFKKISYSQKSKDLGLIVTAGIYVDDVEKQIAEVNQSISFTFIGIIIALFVVVSLIIIYTLIKPMKKMNDIAKSVSEGNLNSTEHYESRDEIGQVFVSISDMRSTLQKLLLETNKLTDSATEGKLDVRGRHNEFKGSYSDLVLGINKTLDSVIAPLNVAAEYIDRISKGDMPPKISDEYKGDFNEIKNNINLCIDSIKLRPLHDKK